MRIVHLIADARRVGGAQAHVLALAAAQRARGDDAAVVDPWANGSLRDLSRRADVVHVHGEPLAPDAQAELDREHRVVRSFHDFAFACASGQHWLRGGAACTRAHGVGCLGTIALRGCAHRRDIRPALRRYTAVGRALPLVRSARATVVYSEYMRSVALANGVAPARCHAIPYFVEPAGSEVAPPADARAVAFVGRLSRAKGVDVLLRGLARDPGAWSSLDVAGDGPERTRLERLARELGLGERVRWHGWLPEDDVRETLRSAAVTVVPSRWPEPFGIVGLEAMALARPVVASKAGGIPEWLDDGATGLLVAPGDEASLASAVSRLTADRDLARELGLEARRRVARFSAEAHLARLDAVYAEAAA